MNTHTLTQDSWRADLFWTRLGSFGFLDPISNHQISSVFLKFRNGLSDHKKVENINYTNVEFRKCFKLIFEYSFYRNMLVVLF